MLLLGTAPPLPKAEAKSLAYIEKRYAELNRAMVGLDASAVGKWLKANASPGFFYRSGDGSSYSASQMVDLLQREFNATGSIKRSDYRMGNFSFHDKQAHCSVTTHLVAYVAKHQRVAVDSTSVEAWTLRGGTWKIDSIVTTAEGPARQARGAANK